MAFSLDKSSLYRNISPSRSPLSPTVVHYQQKYPTPKTSSYHRETKRRHERRHRRAKKSPARQQSPFNSLWEVHQSSNGRIYYYNVLTDQSQWEKPSKEQISSINTKKSIPSKRTSPNKNNSFLNKQYRSKISKRSISSSSSNDPHSFPSRSSYDDKRSFNTISRRKSSLKKSRKDHTYADELQLSTPISPPANEKIHIDLVDPIPTPSTSVTNTSSIRSIIPQQQQYNHQVSTISLDQLKVKTSDSKQSIKRQINADLSSTIIQSSLHPSESTINAILQLEHSSPIQRPCSSSSVSTMTNFNSDHITRYYRAELIEHLLNWPSTQIEREAIRLSNEQIRHTTYRLASLRTDLFSIRQRFQLNRLHLLKYHYILLVKTIFSINFNSLHPIKSNRIFSPRSYRKK